MKSSTISPAQSCLAFVLAGGRGTRLFELTDRDCKPAIPFAGSSRIVDFVLANLLNSGIKRAYMATQYQPKRLINHVKNRWDPRFAAIEGSISCLGSGADNEADGYRGTADAVFRNIGHIDDIAPRHVLVLAADHVYQMDYSAMLAQHASSGAEITIAADIVPRRSATGFGVIEADAAGRVVDFAEKPGHPAGLPEDPERALASMGIYVFDWPRLRELLIADARDATSSHDFGKDILPRLVAGGKAQVHRFQAPRGGAGYWRDVGTIDALHSAHMDLLTDAPGLDLEGWPLHAGWLGNRSEVAGRGSPCLVYPGSEAIAAHLSASAIGPLVSVQAGASIERSVLMTGSSVGPDVRLRDVVVAPGTHIEGPFAAGFDPVEDQIWFRRTEAGVLLIDQMMFDKWQLARRISRGWTRGTGRATLGQPFPDRQYDYATILKTQ